MSSTALIGWMVAIVVVAGSGYLLINNSKSETMMSGDRMMASTSDSMMASSSDSMKDSDSHGMTASTSAAMHVEGAMVDSASMGADEMMTH